MQPRDVVEAWLGAFNRHDADACAELCADDVHFVAGGGKEIIDGNMVLMTDLKLAFEHWEKWTLTPNRWTCEDDRCVVEVHNYAICGDTGKLRETEDCIVFVVRRGRIVEMDFYFDSAATRDANTRDTMTPTQLEFASA
ncbi:MAG TPA: nuclear transport factor 2 family protein [Nitriliruptorales bacterium]|nr:nuclear transport factor 2 family protein [Nitriliruptorales bacterium]